MFDKLDIHSTIILTFFAFLGGLTRELNDVTNCKLRVKTFIIGLITASTTGFIVSQILLEYEVGFHLACFLTGISGFMGPYVLLSIAKIVKRRLKAYEVVSKHLGEDEEQDRCE